MAWRNLGAFIGEDGATYVCVPPSEIDTIIRNNLDSSGSMSYDEYWPNQFSIGQVSAGLQGSLVTTPLDAPGIVDIAHETSYADEIDYAKSGYAVRFKNYNGYEYYLGVPSDYVNTYYLGTVYVRDTQADGVNVRAEIVPKCMKRRIGGNSLDWGEMQSWFVPPNLQWYYYIHSENPDVDHDIAPDTAHVYANYIYVDDELERACVVTMEQCTRTSYMYPVEPREYRVRIKTPLNNTSSYQQIFYHMLEETTPPAPPEPEPEDWHSIDIVSGHGQTRQLATVKDEYLGTGSYATNQQLDRVSRMPPLSNMRDMVEALEVDTWGVVQFSGEQDFMEIKKSAASGAMDISVRFTQVEGLEEPAVIFEHTYSLGQYDNAYLGAIKNESLQIPIAHVNVVIHATTNRTVSWATEGSYTAEQEQALYSWFISHAGTPNPYEEVAGGESQPQGGKDFAPQPDDDVTPYDLPTTDGLDTGFYTIYNPSPNDLQALCQYLWSDGLWETLSKSFCGNDISRVVIKLMILPYPLTVLQPYLDNNSGNGYEISAGNVRSGVRCPIVTQRFIEWYCGYTMVNVKWDSFLDFAPNSSAHVYLPFIGERELDINKIVAVLQNAGTENESLKVNSVLKLVYRIDLFTGALVAMLFVNSDQTATAEINGSKGDKLVAQFDGVCGLEIPISSGTSDALQKAVNFCSSVSQLASSFTNNVTNVRSTPPPANAPVVNGVPQGGKTVSNQSLGGMVGSMGGAVGLGLGLLPMTHVSTAGGINPGVSVLYSNVPYLELTRPELAFNPGQESYTGQPAYQIDPIGKYKGFVEIVDAHIENISATADERREIEGLLREGVIVTTGQEAPEEEVSE